MIRAMISEVDGILAQEEKLYIAASTWRSCANTSLSSET